MPRKEIRVKPHQRRKPNKNEKVHVRGHTRVFEFIVRDKKRRWQKVSVETRVDRSNKSAEMEFEVSPVSEKTAEQKMEGKEIIHGDGGTVVCQTK
jgi:hypothetical protein